MPYGMYMSAEGAKVQAQRLEFIANNLANVDTAGFKRDVPTFQARFAEAVQQGQATPGDRSLNNVGGGVKLMEVDTDFSRSTLRSTAIPTDLAINGQGFFTIRDADGDTLLTRSGDFSIDANGRLLTQNGRFPVLDDGGGEITINTQQPWSVGRNGVIQQQDTTIAIGLAQPESLGDLVKVGANQFRSLGPVAPLPAAERDVRQGYLEQSGVNATREMMAMIETSRAFEANTRLVQHQDSMLSSLLSRVLAS